MTLENAGFWRPGDLCARVCRTGPFGTPTGAPELVSSARSGLSKITDICATKRHSCDVSDHTSDVSEHASDVSRFAALGAPPGGGGQRQLSLGGLRHLGACNIGPHTPQLPRRTAAAFSVAWSRSNGPGIIENTETAHGKKKGGASSRPSRLLAWEEVTRRRGVLPAPTISRSVVVSSPSLLNG